MEASLPLMRNSPQDGRYTPVADRPGSAFKAIPVVLAIAILGFACVQISSSSDNINHTAGPPLAQQQLAEFSSMKRNFDGGETKIVVPEGKPLEDFLSPNEVNLVGSSLSSSALDAIYADVTSKRAMFLPDEKLALPVKDISTPNAPVPSSAVYKKSSSGADAAIHQEEEVKAEKVAVAHESKAQKVAEEAVTHTTESKVEEAPTAASDQQQQKKASSSIEVPNIDPKELEDANFDSLSHVERMEVIKQRLIDEADKLAAEEEAKRLKEAEKARLAEEEAQKDSVIAKLENLASIPDPDPKSLTKAQRSELGMVPETPFIVKALTGQAATSITKDGRDVTEILDQQGLTKEALIAERLQGAATQTNLAATSGVNSLPVPNGAN